MVRNDGHVGNTTVVDYAPSLAATTSPNLRYVIDIDHCNVAHNRR